jgi:hypothetical protein
MDDIKLFAKNEKQLRDLIMTVKEYADNMNMKFGLDKCKVVIVRKGRLHCEAEDFQVGENETIEALKEPEDSYKYLGILQLNDIKNSAVKEKTTAEYKRRVKAILRTELRGKNKIEAINSLAIPVVRYTGGIIKWNKEDLQNMDRATRKLLCAHRGFAQKDDVDRLYVRRENGGRGLLKVEDVIRQEEVSLDEYEEGTTRKAIEAKMEQMRLDSEEECIGKWKSKPLHGQYMRDLPQEIDMIGSFRWLTKGKLTIETEGTITAAQDQAIKTRAIAKRIYGQGTTDRCRVCGKSPETALHILAECSQLAQTEYLERHNGIARYVHWKLLQNLQISSEAKHWSQHEPLKCTEDDRYKLLWDFPIHTDMAITARRPDIVVVDKNKKCGQIIDINCPNDMNVYRNETVKMAKYTELKIELERIWAVRFEVVPVVIGCLGAVSNRRNIFMKKLGLTTRDADEMQAIALRGSCRILRKIITQTGIND